MSQQTIPTFSFWEKQFYSKADIVIIGNGIVGLQCAIQLKKKFPNRKVWVVDRAPTSLGASMRNAGFACFGSMGEILDDIRRTTEEKAFALYEKRYQGIGMLLEDFGQTEIGYEKTGGFEIFSFKDQLELEKILENTDKVNEHLKAVTGEIPFVKKSTEKLGMNILGTGIYTPLEGALQTHLLYDRIYSKCIESGVKIFGGITISGFEKRSGNSWDIINKEGYPLAARKIILCTNGFTKELIPELDVIPARGQVLVTSHIPGLQWRGLMHADKGYIYFRSLGTRILIGGARNLDFDGETTTDLSGTEQIQQRLIEFLKEVIIPGENFEITDHWSGIMGMHEDRSPIVKRIEPGLYACVRMGGMGVALSALVSRELAGMVEENEK